MTTSPANDELAFPATPTNLKTLKGKSCYIHAYLIRLWYRSEANGGMGRRDLSRTLSPLNRLVFFSVIASQSKLEGKEGGGKGVELGPLKIIYCVLDRRR